MNRRIATGAYIPSGGSAEGKAGVLVYEARDEPGYGGRSPTGWRPGARPDCWPAARALHPCCPGCCSCPAGTPALLPLCGRLLAVCGSINPVSLEQCAQAEAQGGAPASASRRSRSSRGTGRPAQAGEMLGAVLRACSQEPVVVLDTGGAVENAGADKTADRIQIANTLGALLKRLLDDGLESTVLIMGGDCLLGLMRQLDVTEIMPLCEVAPGVVLSQFTYGGRQWNLVSKSGGFGAKTLFYDLQNILERWKKELPAV